MNEFARVGFSSGSYTFYYILRWQLLSQNIAENYSTVRLQALIQCNGSYISWSSGSASLHTDNFGLGTYYTAGNTVVRELDINIYHEADGTKTQYIGGSINTTYLMKGSCGGNITLPTIPRTSSISGGSGNIESSSRININRASGNFIHNLYFSFGNITNQLIASGVGDYFDWVLPASLYAQIPNSNSGVGTIICNTYYGSTFIGQSSCGFTANVINSNPIFDSSKISYLDSNLDIVAITGDNQKIVRNKSNLRVSYSSAVAKNYASISKYEITLNGSTQTKTSAATIDYGTVNIANDITLSIKVIDSRGNSTIGSITIKFIDWLLPSASILLNRLNNYEDETYLKVTGVISSVDSKNSINYLKYRFKKTSEQTYSSYFILSNDQQVTIFKDKLYSWNFQVEIADRFGSTTYDLVLQKGMPILFLDTEKLSVGINCFPTKNNSTELGGGLYIQIDGVAIPIIEIVDN